MKLKILFSKSVCLNILLALFPNAIAASENKRGVSRIVTKLFKRNKQSTKGVVVSESRSKKSFAKKVKEFAKKVTNKIKEIKLFTRKKKNTQEESNYISGNSNESNISQEPQKKKGFKAAIKSVINKIRKPNSSKRKITKSNSAVPQEESTSILIKPKTWVIISIIALFATLCQKAVKKRNKKKKVEHVATGSNLNEPALQQGILS